MDCLMRLRWNGSKKPELKYRSNQLADKQIEPSQNLEAEITRTQASAQKNDVWVLKARLALISLGLN